MALGSQFATVCRSHPELLIMRQGLEETMAAQKQEILEISVLQKLW